MRQKDAGFAERLLPVLLSTGIVLGFILLSAQWMELYRTRENVNQIARAYLLEMETKGYLSTGDINSLKAELQKAGVKEVLLEGTTTSPQAYGASIQLAIAGNIDVDLNVAIPFFYETNKTWKIPLKLNLYSTAKH